VGGEISDLAGSLRAFCWGGGGWADGVLGLERADEYTIRWSDCCHLCIVTSLMM
jgi:hypothetical protein